MESQTYEHVTATYASSGGRLDPASTKPGGKAYEVLKDVILGAIDIAISKDQKSCSFTLASLRLRMRSRLDQVESHRMHPGYFPADNFAALVHTVCRNRLAGFKTEIAQPNPKYNRVLTISW